MRTDDELLAAAAAGDADAFAAVFRRHERAVTRFAIHRCASPDEVADAVSETFLVAFRSAGRYRHEHPSALPWLLGIAVRIVLHQQRAARRRVRLLGRVAAATPRYEGEEADAIAAAIDAARRGPELAAALARLPARERVVLELVVDDDLSAGEVAAALAITPNAARVRLSRARRRLREALDDAPSPTELPEASHA